MSRFQEYLDGISIVSKRTAAQEFVGLFPDSMQYDDTDVTFVNDTEQCMFNAFVVGKILKEHSVNINPIKQNVFQISEPTKSDNLPCDEFSKLKARMDELEETVNKHVKHSLVSISDFKFGVSSNVGKAAQSSTILNNVTMNELPIFPDTEIRVTTLEDNMNVLNNAVKTLRDRTSVLEDDNK